MSYVALGARQEGSERAKCLPLAGSRTPQLRLGGCFCPREGREGGKEGGSEGGHNLGCCWAFRGWALSLPHVACLLAPLVPLRMQAGPLFILEYVPIFPRLDKFQQQICSQVPGHR